ncbi:MAG: GFA family protein, partial [Rhizobiaceae bacterium]
MVDGLKLPLTGGCQCGKLRYRVTAQPATLYCCHCTECQAQSSSAFGMSLRVPSGAVEIDGKSAYYFRDPDRDTA